MLHEAWTTGDPPMPTTQAVAKNVRETFPPGTLLDIIGWARLNADEETKCLGLNPILRAVIARKSGQAFSLTFPGYNRPHLKAQLQPGAGDRPADPTGTDADSRSVNCTQIFWPRARIKFVFPVGTS